MDDILQLREAMFTALMEHDLTTREARLITEKMLHLVLTSPLVPAETFQRYLEKLEEE